jgi:four helix bundle protein
LAKQLAVDSYRLAASLPDTERYGLRSQLQRSAVSAAVNLVEGSTRRHSADWVRFLEISQGSAAEAGFLIGLAVTLGMLPESKTRVCSDGYDKLVRSLQKMIDALSGPPRTP